MQQVQMNMKKIFIILLALLSISAPANASVISHRYMIPETDDLYSIEFPMYFLTLSSDMDKFDPAVSSFGVDLEESKKYIQEGPFEMVAQSENKLALSVFIEKIEDPDGGFSSQDMKDEELEEWADDIASAYFEINKDSVYPSDTEDPGFVYDSGKLKFVYWSYFFYEEDIPMLTEHFALFEPDYMLDISFLYDISDKQKYEEALDVAIYIVNSIIPHK